MRNNPAPALSNSVKPDTAMKTQSLSSRRDGFNSLDLLVMLLAVAVVVMVGLAFLRSRQQPMSKRINCANNLKQIGLSYRIWASDSGDKPPPQVSANIGGTMELVASGLVFPHFAAMSNELGTPKIIVCPEDTKRQWGTNFATLTDTNVSYFVVPEADESLPNLILSGDRNLTTNKVALKPGLFTLTTNRVVMGWTSQIHQDAGNIALADGSVQQPSSRRLHEFATNSLAATTNSTFRIAIP